MNFWRLFISKFTRSLHKISSELSCLLEICCHYYSQKVQYSFSSIFANIYLSPTQYANSQFGLFNIFRKWSLLPSTLNYEKYKKTI